MSTSFYPVKPGGAEDKADVGITLLICPVTQIGRPTRDAVSYCLCCFFYPSIQANGSEQPTQMGTSPSSALVRADELEWLGRKNSTDSQKQDL